MQLDAEDSLALKTRPRRRRRPARGSRSSSCRTCRTRPTSGCSTWADWITRPAASDYDFIVLPGTKNTIADLRGSASTGLADWILAQHRRRRDGRSASAAATRCWAGTIDDPDGIESDLRIGRGTRPAARDDDADAREADASGARDARRRRDVRRLRDPPRRHDARRGGARRAVRHARGRHAPTASAATGVIGTYLHGALEHAEVCAEVFGIDAAARQIEGRALSATRDWFERHGRHLDRLGFD